MHGCKLQKKETAQSLCRVRANGKGKTMKLRI